jgi:hypothetical protein
MNRPAFRCTSRYHQRMGTAGRMGTIMERTSEHSKRGPEMERTSERSKRGHIVLGIVGLLMTGAVLLHSPAPAHAQPSDKKPVPVKTGVTPPTTGNAGTAAKPGNNGKPKVFDFTGLDIAGRLRTPQLMYFLERANEELERASLEKRSFVPSMVRSIDDEAL